METVLFSPPPAAHFRLHRMQTISIRGYKCCNVLFLERAPSSAGDELLSKLLSAEKTYNNRASTKFLIALLLLQCNYLFKSCRWRSYENLLPDAFSAAIQLCFYTKSSPLCDPWGGKSLL
jgi:hypothetical protein